MDLSKTIHDDELRTCMLLDTRQADDYTEYHLQPTSLVPPVWVRYSTVRALNRQIQEYLPADFPKLPPRRMLKNANATLCERAFGLPNYFTALFALTSLPWKVMLEVADIFDTNNPAFLFPPCLQMFSSLGQPVCYCSMSDAHPAPVYFVSLKADPEMKVCLKRLSCEDEVLAEIRIMANTGQQAEVLIDGDDAYLVRPISGLTLKDFVNSLEEQLDETSRLELARKAAVSLFNALDKIHRAGYANLDINPETIVFSENLDTVHFISWGLCSTKSGTWVPPYEDLNPICRAPQLLEVKEEQDLGLDVLKSCDVWSVGVIIFFIAVGRWPFGAEDDSDLLESILKLNYSFHHNPRLTKKFKRFITGILELEPSSRFGFGHPDVGYDLQRI